MSIVQETWDVQFLYLETKINIVEKPGRFLFWFLRWGLTLGMAGPKLKIFLTQPPKLELQHIYDQFFNEHEPGLRMRLMGLSACLARTRPWVLSSALHDNLEGTGTCAPALGGGGSWIRSAELSWAT